MEKPGFSKTLLIEFDKPGFSIRKAEFLINLVSQPRNMVSRSKKQIYQKLLFQFDKPGFSIWEEMQCIFVSYL